MQCAAGGDRLAGPDEQDQPPRFHWRRPIHGGAGYARMPDGCIWAGLAWLVGGVPTSAWIVYSGWPACAGFFNCTGAFLLLGLKAAFIAALWPLYWIVWLF